MSVDHRKPLALITGASSGLGREYARKLASEGYDLIIVARRESILFSMADELNHAYGSRVQPFKCDLGSEADLARLLKKIERSEWQVDFLVNNAGYGTHGAFVSLGVARELTMIDVNCRAIVAISHEVGKQMKDRGRGTIIHTASVGGLAPTPYFAVYGATKAFVVSFSESLSCELASYGVRVQTLCPGATDTEFGATAGFKGEMPPWYAIETPEGVVRKSYEALAARPQRSLVISSSLYRLTVFLGRLFPRRVLLNWAAKMNLPQGT